MDSAAQTIDFEAARRAMVASQLRPVEVADAAVLRAMAAVAREAFVPVDARPLAYADGPLPLGDGRALAAPAVTGRLLDALAPLPGERALVVGAASGYGAALLAEIGLAVVALDCDPRFAAGTAGATGTASPAIERVTGPLAAGWPTAAPYDLILVDGAVPRLPQALVDQLGEGGRLAAVLDDCSVHRPSVYGRSVRRLVVGRKAAGGFSLHALTEADAPALPGFDRPRAFTF